MSRNEGSPVASSTDPEIRRLGEQVRAFLRSDEFLSRLNIGKIVTIGSGTIGAFGWGELNRVQLTGNGTMQLPPIEPAWIGKPLYVSKLTASGVMTVIGTGKSAPTVDGSATGIQISTPGLREFITDGANWFSGSQPSGIASAGTNGPPFPVANAFRLPATFSPIALYQFDGNTLDSSGHALDLTVEAGTIRYAPIHPGAMGAILGGGGASGCRLIATGLGATMLALTGDISLEMIAWQEDRPTSVLAGPWVSYAGQGGLEVDNALWSYFTNANNGPEWYQEFGASVPSTLGLNVDVATPPLMRPLLHGARRASGILQFFQDGKPYGTLTSTGLTLPTGGSVAHFRIGGSQAGTQSPKFLCSSLKVVGTGLSDAAFLADYNASMGLYYGTRT